MRRLIEIIIKEDDTLDVAEREMMELKLLKRGFKKVIKRAKKFMKKTAAQIKALKKFQMAGAKARRGTKPPKGWPKPVKMALPPITKPAGAATGRIDISKLKGAR